MIVMLAYSAEMIAENGGETQNWLLAFLDIFDNHFPVILPSLIAIFTIIFATKREVSSQRFNFKKDFYLKHYDSMLELLAEYDATFDIFDYYHKMYTLKDLNDNQEIDGALKQAVHDVSKINIIRAKIDLMINPMNPHAEPLSKALNSASWGAAILIVFETIMKIPNSGKGNNEVLTNLSSDTDSHCDKDVGEHTDNDTKPNYFLDEITKVQKMREDLQREAKKYLAAERKMLLSRKGR